MKKTMFLLMLAAMSVAISSDATAATVAYWRFEAGPADATVEHVVGTAGVWSADIPDVSGNGNDLSVWETGSSAGFYYRSDVATAIVPQFGTVNNYSAKNSGGGPAMWTSSSSAMRTMAPSQWTIEAVFKLENGGYRTIIGRDSQGTATTNSALAALYLQAITASDAGLTNALAIKYCDVTGVWHQAISGTNAFTGFTYSSDPDGANGKWYAVAAVSDGTLLSLYLNDIAAGTGYKLIAQTDMTGTSTDTALTAGAGDGGDWDAGNWTVARGLYNGGHVDRGYGFVDEVRISDSALPVGKFLFSEGGSAVEISPADGAVEVAVGNITLSWQAGTDPNDNVLPGLKGYYVYFGEEFDALYQMNDTLLPAETTTFNVGTQATDTTYYWMIEEAVDNGQGGSYAAGDPNNVVSPVWSFTTIISSPVFTDQPDDVLADMDGTAEFNVSVDSISTPHFVWKMSEDKTNDTPDDDDTVGTDSVTLTLSNVNASHEGFYYCVATNDSGISVASDVASLEVKRVVAWYAFENDITDSIGDNDGTSLKTDPNVPFTYGTGVTGQAISLNGTEDAISIPRSIQNSFSIELWIKTTATGGTTYWWNGRGLVDGEVSGWNQNDFGVVLLGSKLAVGVGNASNSSQVTISSTTSINDGQWHYCIATRDHVTGQIKVYVDGAQENSATASTGTKDSADVLRIGGIRTGGNFLAGQLDEIKLYNYPLAEMTVAAQYNSMTGETVCILSQKPDTKYDLNGDCVVDIEDFVEFASAWLDCGLFPDCQ